MAPGEHDGEELGEVFSTGTGEPKRLSHKDKWRNWETGAKVAKFVAKVAQPFRNPSSWSNVSPVAGWPVFNPSAKD